MIAIGMKAACDAVFGALLDAQAPGRRAMRPSAGDAGLGADAPDVRPPWATRRRAHDGAQFSSLARFQAACGVDLRSRGVFRGYCGGGGVHRSRGAVGFRESGDGFGGEEGGGDVFARSRAARPIFPLACGGGRVKRKETLIKRRAAPELREGVWLVGEEKGVEEVDIEGPG